MRAGLLIGVAACLSLVGCQEDAPSTSVDAPAVTTPARVPEVVRTPRSTKPAAVPSRKSTAEPLLRAAPGGDGDSWKDTRGVSYRLGLVNAPELSECYGEAASRKRKDLTAAGFRATAYTRDGYGRHISVVYLADGRNLNVWLARNGYANDRYLKQFRHENPSLAAQLDPAFAAAKRERRGLWAACGGSQPQGSAAQAPSPAAALATRDRCEPAYPDVCIPPSPPDLDCPDISYRRFRVLAPDPHRFDADGDGIGCESG